jgi:hypothetical protein
MRVRLSAISPLQRSFARTNNARNAFVARTLSIAFSVVQRLKLHPLDRTETGYKPVGLADRLNRNGLAIQKPKSLVATQANPRRLLSYC